MSLLWFPGLSYARGFVSRFRVRSSAAFLRAARSERRSAKRGDLARGLRRLEQRRERLPDLVVDLVQRDQLLIAYPGRAEVVDVDGAVVLPLVHVIEGEVDQR
jgi:hypothetical protein